MVAFEEGVEARKAGVCFDALPPSYVLRVTKLGTPVPNDNGIAWQAGWVSVGRTATRLEVEAANRLTNLGQFRSRHRRDY